MFVAFSPRAAGLLAAVAAVSLGLGPHEALGGPSAPRFRTLFSFADQLSQSPSEPAGNLVPGPAGSFYGVTSYGGASEYGTVFQLQHTHGAWQVSQLYAFGAQGGDGIRPENTVTPGLDGTLYGTTTVGGAHAWGTVYALSPSRGGGWTETVLWSFGAGDDGQYPSSGIAIGPDGTLYGVTVWGGTAGVGIAYALKPPAARGGAWTETILHNFTGSLSGPSDDGAWPYGGLTIAPDGKLYGTTYYGGSGVCPYTCGTVYALRPGGDGKSSETIVYNFRGQPNDGEFPFSGVTPGAKGALFATTYKGGPYNDCLLGCGTVIALKPSRASGDWTESVIHAFTIDDPEGGLNPIGGLTAGRHGVLYGTTQNGGAQSYYCGIYCGTVYELTPSRSGSWTETVLHNFTDQNGDGEAPQATLIVGKSGALYGTTLGGGLYTGGTAFVLKPATGQTALTTH